MKKTQKHIVCTWIMLICFTAGQWAVYAHQHFSNATVKTHHTAQNQTTVTDKCQLCDAMHHNSMVNAGHNHFPPVVVTGHFYKQGKYDFVSIALILSAGRSPPVS